MPQIKYTNDQIAKYLDEYRASGLSVTDAAASMGVDKRTLERWLRKDNKVKPGEIQEVGMDHRKTIAKKALGLVNRMLVLTTDDDIRKASLAARFSAIKAGLDVAQILDGEPTSITVQKMTEEKRMEVLMDLMKRIEERREKQAALPSAERKLIPVKDKPLPAWVTEEKKKLINPEIVEETPSPQSDTQAAE